MPEKRFNEIVEEVLAWFEKAPKNNRMNFLASSEAGLIVYHDNLGRTIRNKFKLWERKWTPDLSFDIDYSEDHPDTISQRVIVEVWRRANEANRT